MDSSKRVDNVFIKIKQNSLDILKTFIYDKLLVLPSLARWDIHKRKSFLLSVIVNF